MRYVIVAILVAILGGAGAVGWKIWDFAKVPPETPGVEQLFVIEQGESFESIAKRLHAAGLIRDTLLFRGMARYAKLGSKVRAGEFELSTGWTPMRLLKELTTSSGVQHKLSVPEGLTVRQVAKIVQDSGFGSAESFMKAAADPALLAKYDIPSKSAEGFLFPETYLFTRRKGDDAAYVVEAMLKEFRRQATEAWDGAPPKGEELFKAVVLASIVEEETGAPAERPKVAGVFLNRLKAGMLLQTDPTIIFGLGEAYDGNLKRSHLEDPKNPYNTYIHPGLPPGPICSPGFASMQAVAHPEEHEFYYFVATGEGAHVFSKNLREHVNNVNKYQRRGRK